MNKFAENNDLNHKITVEMLRKVRKLMAVIIFILITLLFLDFTGTIHLYFGWLAKIQLMPAILSLNFMIIVLLAVLTILFGRIYCSVICPLGIFQDIISNIRGRFKKNRFSFSPEVRVSRYLFLAAFILALFFGFNALVALLEPYSTFGRIASVILSPLYKCTNNMAAFIAERMDSYAFYRTEILLPGLSVIIAAVAMFALTFFLSWRSGRTYCNTVCPVGTFLGLISRFSIFKIRIDESKCNKCTLCSRNCKSSCINTKEGTIDYSRCVVCMDCIDKCRQSAISFSAFGKKRGKEPKKKEPEKQENADKARRAILTGTAVFAATSMVKAETKKVDGGLAVLVEKQNPKRTVPVLPAGALSLRNMQSHCTACQLCVSVCPNKVLVPSDNLMRLMQPEMSFRNGYCRPECTKCSEVCPAGAITGIDKEEKSSIQTGHAVWIKENCIVNTDDVDCGNCSRHCPAGAIKMIRKNPDDRNSKRIPSVDTEKCIGCGSCEYHCPARPFSAIYVEGHLSHRII